jgi:hypothetical protein
VGGVGAKSRQRGGAGENVTRREVAGRQGNEMVRERADAQSLGFVRRRLCVEHIGDRALAEFVFALLDAQTFLRLLDRQSRSFNPRGGRANVRFGVGQFEPTLQGCFRGGFAAFCWRSKASIRSTCAVSVARD